MADGFSRLSPALQYQIVNALGFKSLRPVQEATIPPIMDGNNAIVLAPTAGGKTEAAFFPLLSCMDAEDWRPTSVLYISPITALLNNQRPRLERLAGLVGRRVAMRHGGVGAAERKAYLREPTDILLTTPESLEVMLISPNVPSRRIFGELRAVVIDEIHAFASDDRGGHLAALLERLTHYCGKDLQRLGLSATVGNPQEILRWLQGSSSRAGLVVDPPRGKSEPKVVLDYVGSTENALAVASKMYRGKKRLIFVDSRAGVERFGEGLNKLSLKTYLLHSSLSKEERRHSERRFLEDSNCILVATSSVELGVDIGDLDHVVQIEAPNTVASFLQRMGRTGRRAGTTANCLFLATDEWAFLKAAGLIRLWDSGFVEPVIPVERAAHLLAHQLMALVLQAGGGLGAGDWWPWVQAATPFHGLSDAERQRLVGHMLQEDILHQSEGRLAFGERGEKLYGRRNFSELYAVFDTPMILRVMYGPREVGSLEATFVSSFGDEMSFTLGGRGWRVKEISWSRGIVHVEPVEGGRAPRWRGEPVMLSPELCQSIQALLTGDEEHSSWTNRGCEIMRSLRTEYAELRAKGPTMLESAENTALWTFAGGRVNLLLGKVLESMLGRQVRSDNFSLRLSEVGGKRLLLALSTLLDANRPNEADATAAVAKMDLTLSKFQPCLPPELEARYLRGRLTDVEGARSVLKAVFTSR